MTDVVSILSREITELTVRLARARSLHRAAVEERRVAQREAVRQLYADGWQTKCIAERVGVKRGTVSEWIRQSDWPRRRPGHAAGRRQWWQQRRAA